MLWAAVCQLCCSPLLFSARRLKSSVAVRQVGIIQPGTGIELVLNEATQRKSSSAAGFTAQEERVYGNEAQNMIGKVPSRIFIMSKLLLGQTLDSQAIIDFKRYLYPYQFEADESTNAAIVRYNANATYRAEEMVAFVLTYAKQIAEGHAQAAVKDCVITIPPFFGHLERQALLDAATIAGLNVLSLLHESTAFAFKYGFDKENDFTAEPTNVVFYDLGASSYKVSIVSFSATVGKKNKTQGGLQVRGLGWDANLGGKDFDDIVLNMMADEFNSKALKGKEDVRDSERAVGKLRKAAESTKDILSANTKYQVGVEALHKDLDLRMIISREDFAAEAARRGLWRRLLAPLNQALDQANLTKEEIHRVEVVGGATRIPQVKQAAMDFFGGRFGKQLDGALNGDEAAAFGATLYAAKLSTSFRLREFAITDSYPYATSIKIVGQGDDTGDDTGASDDETTEGGGSIKKGKDKLLFKANTKMPHKKLITMTRTDDLLATLSMGEPREPENLARVATFNITGVAAAYARLLKDETRVVLGKPKVSVTFALSSSGLIDVSKAEMAIEMLETYDDFEMVPDPNVTTVADDAADDGNVADGDAAGDTDTAAMDANASAPLANATNATKMIKVKVQRERKRLHYVTLKAAKTVLGSCVPISQEIINGCIARNVELLKAEQLRKTNAEAKNALESFIIETRDKLSEEGVEQVSTDEERESLRTQFDEAEEWLYGEGVALDAVTYHKRQKAMQALTLPIFTRYSELEARPKAVREARDAINWTLTIIETWATERPEVTIEERTKVGGMCTNFTSWLDDVEAKQAELPLTSPPVFLSASVAAKLEPIEVEVRKLIKKPKPKPPKLKKNATGTGSDQSNSSAEETADAKPNAEGKEESQAKAEDLPGHDEL